MFRVFRFPLFLLYVVATGAVCGQETPTDKVQPNVAAIAKVEAVSPEAAAFFEKKIRPVLVAECYGCHSSEDGKKRRAGLALDTREGTRLGGDSGAVIVPGNPARSLLIKALTHVDQDLKMPPTKKLDANIVRDFEEWIRQGAPDPRQDMKRTRSNLDLETGRNHWAYRPVQAVQAPSVKRGDWPRGEIDHHVLAALEAKGLTPLAKADRRTLLRRVTLDLTGLPPTTADMDAFVTSDAPDSYERAVDRLLASPAFGEKWARHWLDVARYAESTGKTVNFNYPHAWRYRDYVIAAFNSDKPFDQFIREQVAGDLMPTDDPRVKAERMIATGFLAIGPKTLNERSGLKFELDVVDEQIDVTTQAFLGITVACARCHDHKFDPIPQADYYALAGIFRSTETCYGTVSFINAQRTSSLLTLPNEANVVAAVPGLTDVERQKIEGQIQFVRDSIRKMKDPVQQFLTGGQLSLLQAKLDAYDPDGNPKLLAMGVRDKSAVPEFGFSRGRFGGPGGYTYDGTRTISDSPVYTRGESDQASASRVPRGTLQVLAKDPLKVPSNHSGRLELAEWIASRQNPLTARVMVNRVWLQLFGRGLVPTADDFGLAGQPPTHPALLDHLANRFMDDGWSVKKLIKYMILSDVYQLSSTADPKSMDVDPDNTLYWRMLPRRLDAESLRDSMLSVSDQLERLPPVGSVVARAGEGPVTRPRFGADPVAGAINDPRNAQRSIYLPILRDNLPEVLDLFDAADPALITADRPRTTVPSQGLFLLNNAFVMRAADKTAERLLEMGSEVDQIQAVFARCFGRPPTEKEVIGARKFLDSYRSQLTREQVRESQRERELWSAFCQAIFASAEFQYRK